MSGSSTGLERLSRCKEGTQIAIFTARAFS
jgi:hypothetical protein